MSLNGLLNKHNVRYWKEEDPRATIETVIQSAKVHRCCSMSESCMIDPYFFEDDDTVNGQNSPLMLKEVLCSRIEKIRQSKLHNFSRVWSTSSF